MSEPKSTSIHGVDRPVKTPGGEGILVTRAPMDELPEEVKVKQVARYLTATVEWRDR